MARITSARDRASASARHRTLPYHCISQSFDLPPATTSVSHLTCPLPPHHQSVLALALVLELELALALEIELALVLDIEHYRITTSVSHLTCPLPPHQSVIWLAHCHHISQSFDLPTATTSSVRASARDRASASARHRALPYHCISQSFDLPPATTSVSHLTCPLPPHHQSELALALALEIELALVLDIEHYGTTASVSHLTCPLPPHQSVIWLAHCHHISQSFDLPTATTSVSHLTCPLPPHQSVIWLAHCHHISQSFDLPTATTSSVRASARDRASASARHRVLPYHCISQSFDLPPATTSVSHLTCPLPPHHQSELALVLALEIELVLALDIERYHITTSVSHLTCPLPPHQSVIWLAHCHHISQSFDLPTATTSSVRASTGTSTRDRASASARHRALWYHCISQSFDLPTATTSVSHLTCPLPPHQSVIWLAHCHHIISQS